MRSTLKGSQPIFDGGHRRICQARVNRALVLQAEALLGVLGGVEDVAGSEVDGEVAGAGGVDWLAGVDLAGGEAPFGSVGVVVLSHGCVP